MGRSSAKGLSSRKRKRAKRDRIRSKSIQEERRKNPAIQFTAEELEEARSRISLATSTGFDIPEIQVPRRVAA